MSLKRVKEKILELQALSNKLSLERVNRKVVFTNGCFDILHRGHIEYLAEAANLGDIFIVGLNSDNSVRLLKGQERPLQDEHSRALILASMEFVDYVVIFDEETPFNLIETLNPSILVKGGDYRIEDIVGADIVQKRGGSVQTIKFIEGCSSTNLINKLLK